MKKTTIIFIVSSFIFNAVFVYDVEARNRKGSHRVGGYNSHGKGSHYVGGR